MADFISEGFFRGGGELPLDVLGHTDLAQALLNQVDVLPHGTVIAVQGAWGQGKTDVLARMVGATYGHEPKLQKRSIGAEALWINPWQYGDPNLLTPLVLALLKRIPPKTRSGEKALKKAAETLLRCGLSFGLKAVGLTMPGGALWDAGAKYADEMLKGLFEAQGQQEKTGGPAPDVDAVAAMAERFADLCKAWLEAATQTDPGVRRLLICVDDLDRCLPDRQVALLEAIRFLISTDAPASFVIAIDPTLARQAVLTHYHTDQFDPDRYLAKMFDTRVSLPSVASDEVAALCLDWLGRSPQRDNETATNAQIVEAAFGQEAAVTTEQAFRDFALVAGLCNPRTLARIFRRLAMWAASKTWDESRLLAGAQWQVAVFWLILVELWPAAREALQGQGGAFVERFAHAHQLYNSDQYYKPENWRDPFLVRMPKPYEDIDVTVAFKRLKPELGFKVQDMGELLFEVDQSLRRAGL